LTKYRNI